MSQPAESSPSPSGPGAQGEPSPSFPGAGTQGLERSHLAQTWRPQQTFTEDLKGGKKKPTGETGSGPIGNAHNENCPKSGWSVRSAVRGQL